MVNIHATAIVDEGALIGDETKVWHWTHVCNGAIIGKNCTLGQNVYVADQVVIGNNVKVQNNVSIYTGVTLEDDVFCGPSMVFTNVINPRAAIVRKTEYKSTLVKKGATLGANCTIICGVTIGEYAFVGAGAVVTSNIKDFALVTGIPATQTGWMSKFGEKIPLPLSGNEKYTCSNTGDIYLLTGSLLKIIR